MLSNPSIALVRNPPHAYSTHYPSVLAQLALEQHRRYQSALESTGVRVHVLPGDESWYDSVFVEDTAIVWGDRVLITRLTPHRAGETHRVREHFSKTHRIMELQNPLSKIEGGDVLHADEVTYIGLSSRTNAEGVEELRQFLAPQGRRVQTVPVEKCLHLKTGATYLGNDTLLIAPDLLPRAAFTSIPHTIDCRGKESAAANAIRLGQSLLFSSRYEHTARKLQEFCEQNVIQAHPLDTSEFEKADGSLTCLSIVF